MRRRNIIIDLTSLLDVILILFFALTLRTQESAAEEIRAARADAEQAAAERDEALASADALSRLLRTEDILLDSSLVITLSVGPDESLRIETEDRESASVPYRRAENTYSYDEIRNRLRALTRSFREESRGASGDRGVFVIFQYDSAAIRKGQYDAVQQAVRGWKAADDAPGLTLNYLELDTGSRQTTGNGGDNHG